MSATGKDVFALLGFIQDDLRKTQAQLVEVRAMLASMPLPAAVEDQPCLVCGVNVNGERRMLEHLAIVHLDEPAALELRALDESDEASALARSIEGDKRREKDRLKAEQARYGKEVPA